MHKILVCAAALAALAACSPKVEKKTGDETVIDTGDGSVRVGPDGSVSVKGADGSGVDVSGSGAVAVSGGGADKVGASLDYPGGQQVMNVSSMTDGKPGRLFGFNTADGADKVLAYYKAKAQALGLKETTIVDGGGTATWSAEGAAGHLVVIVSNQGAQNYVQVTWSAGQ